MNKNLFLITTAEKASWRYNSSILFLGEWCKTYENKSDRKTFNAKVADYHWDDRKKVFNDCCSKWGGIVDCLNLPLQN